MANTLDIKTMTIDHYTEVNKYRPPVGSVECILHSSMIRKLIFETTFNPSKAVVLYQSRRWASRDGKRKNSLPFEDELVNPIAILNEAPPKFGTKGPGFIYDKKPFRVRAKKYHVYNWCGCGLSKNQPFCDNTHAMPQLKSFVRGSPVKYIAPEDKDVWLCNCKQTKRRPFCDGSHRTDPDVIKCMCDGKLSPWDPKSSRQLNSTSRGVKKS